MGSTEDDFENLLRQNFTCPRCSPTAKRNAPTARIPLEFGSEFFVGIWKWLKCIDLSARQKNAYRCRKLSIVSANVDDGSHTSLLYPRLVYLDKFSNMH